MSRRRSDDPGPPAGPPRLLQAVLRRLLPPGDVGEGILGDMEEEFHRTARRSSRASARLRWTRQGVGIAARLLAHRLVRAFPDPTTRETMLPSLVDDARHALRSLARARGFSALAVLTLAAGIGATTAVFGIVDAVLLRPLPYPEADALVVPHFETDGRAIRNHSEPEFFDYQADLQAFEQVAAYRRTRPTFGSGAEAERLPVLEASADLLPLLRVEPALGRVFTAAEDRPGDDAAPVVLSYGLWTRAFGADPGIVGRTVRLEDAPHVVVGVMPDGFAFPDPEIEAWTPLRLDPADPWGRNNHYLQILARLAPGVGLETAAAQLEALARRNVERFPDTYPETLRFPVGSLRDEIVGDVRTPLTVLFGAVTLVLLVAAVNAAALFLARGEQRRGEIAVRTALGAGRGRVVRHLLFESLGVAGSAAVSGVVLAWVGVRALGALAPPDLPRLAEVGLDARVLAFGLGLALVTGLAFGLAPALQASRSDLRQVLASGGRGGVGRPGQGRGRRGLVVAQLAFATVLLLGAGLLVRSFAALRSVDPGFDPSGVLAVDVSPTQALVGEGAQVAAFYRDLETRVAALPGVESVGAALRLALEDGEDNYSIQVEGRLAETSADAPVAGMQYATPGYRTTLGIDLVAGRWFSESDGADAPLVAVVNRRMARELWPGEDPVGRRLRMFPDGNPWMEVVGVVEDVSYLGLRVPPPAKLYIPHRQGWRSAYYSPASMTLLIRTAGDPALLAGPVRAAVAEVRPGVPVGPVRTLPAVVSRALGPDRFVLLLLTGFAAVALFMAAVSIYGVVARSVAARTREIGVRMALGADRRVVAGEVVREGAVLGAVGCALGLAVGALAVRAAAPLLFGVTLGDPWAWGLVAPVLGLTSVLACAVPARRAASLDPVEALRGA